MPTIQTNGIHQGITPIVVDYYTDVNDFYVIAVLSVAGGALALFLRSGKPKSAAGPVHVEL